MSSYNFKFRTMSPLHIGTGDEIDPFMYVIKESISDSERKKQAVIADKYAHILKNKPNKLIQQQSNKEYILYYFDTNKLIMLLTNNERAELKSVLSMYSVASINPVRKVLYKIFNPELHADTIIGKYKVNEAVYKYYISEIENKEYKNQLKLSTIYRNKYFEPVIPGSSIKGALRTAFLFQNNISEKSITIDKDPFQLLRISDSYRAASCNTTLGFIHKFKREELSLYNDIYSLAEYIPNNKNFIINMDFINNVNTDKFNQKAYSNLKHIFSNSDNIINMLNSCYKDEFEYVYKLFEQKCGDKHPFIQNVQEIRNKIDRPVAFIQIGKYGGKSIKLEKKLSDENDVLKSRSYLSYKRLKSNWIENGDEYLYNVFPIGWVSVYLKK